MAKPKTGLPSILKMKSALLPGLLYLSSPAAILTVSPFGRESAPCTGSDPCSLIGARDRARKMLPGSAGDVIVRLSGGTYRMDSALTLDKRDAGRPGARMVYEAAPGERPVLSGGRRITGWTISDTGKGIWRADVPPSLRTRQLYVNDARAIRARGPQDPPGFSKTGDGFSAPDGLGFEGGADGAELVSRSSWKEFRCPIDTLDGNEIKVSRPCWDDAQEHSPFTMDRISWIENAYGLLDEEGEWYLDETHAKIFYKPRPGEDMVLDTIVVPVLETLLEARGSAARSLGYLTISGLAFAHTTWMGPSTAKGYPDLQSTYLYGDNGYGGDKAASSVSFWFADSLVLAGNAFRAMGGNGPSLEAGCRNSRVYGNTFSDISGNGLHIGNIVANPADPRERNQGITIDNNRITRIGREFHGSSGVFIGYSSGTRVLHNEIHDIPYTGISMGWGWGKRSYMKDNEVAYNLVHDHMQVMEDGGGIYTLGSQPGTRIHHNYIHSQIHEFGALYPDEGSSFMRWDSNVVQNAARWLHMWSDAVYAVTVVGNFSDSPLATLAGRECMVESNTMVPEGPWPEAAGRIMAEAGLEPRFRASSQSVQSPTTGTERESRFKAPAPRAPRLTLDLAEGALHVRTSAGYRDFLGKSARR